MRSLRVEYDLATKQQQHNEYILWDCMLILKRYPSSWDFVRLLCVCAKSVHSCLTLCDPVDYSPPSSSVHKIFQARILKWIAMPFSRGSSQVRDRTWVSYVSCIDSRVLYYEGHLGSLISMWNECNCMVVWTVFGIFLIWDGNENGPFPVLCPLLSFPNLLTYWVQHFNSIIFYNCK